jgi:hypothetical protein
MKAVDACYLAIAEARRGNISQAYDYFDEAKGRNPACPLIDRTFEEITCVR